MKIFPLHEFVKFLIVGIANTLVGLSVIYLAKWFFGLNDVYANVVGYTVGISVSFTMNSRWTFSYGGSHTVALFKFLLVSLIAYAMNLVAVMISIYWLKLDPYLSQALGVPPYTLTSYLASKYLVFRKTLQKPPDCLL